MKIPKDLLDAYFCKWEEEYHQAFNKELIELGMEPIAYKDYFSLLQQEAIQDDLIAPSPRIR
jgi:hypothetical protein